MSSADGRGPLTIRPATSADRPWIDAFLHDVGATRVARRGELVRPTDHPMLMAVVDGVPAGLLTWSIVGDACERLTLHALDRGQGIGTALLDAIRERAAAEGCRTLWLVTTNDNLDAFRFSQRRGFHIRAIHEGAVDDARRRLKPEIPEIGDHGIPISDEIELEREIDAIRA